MAKEQAIRFQHGASELAGLLVTPSGRGPHPAVVFVHGSGPENRDGGGMYRRIWEHFTRRGFACVSWDKPGVGESTGDWRTHGYPERAQEVIAALRFLQTLPEIDSSRIGLWGLSEGGLVCTLAASLVPEIAFAIVVSSPAGSLVERELFHVAAQMRAERATEEAIRSACDVVLRELELIREGAPLAEVVAVSGSMKSEPWFKTFEYVNGQQSWTPALYESVRRHMASDTVSVLTRVKCPVLAIWGELDCTVSAKRGREIFREHLACHNRDVTLKVFANADHALFPTITGSMREMLESWQRLERFVPGYLETMADWLAQRLLAGKS